MKVKVLRPGNAFAALASLTTERCLAFNHNVPRSFISPVGNLLSAHTRGCSPNYSPCSRSSSRGSLILQMDQTNQEQGESQLRSEDQEIFAVDASRRAALRRCCSIFGATAFATALNQQKASASGFSGSIDEMAWEREPSPPAQTMAPPQFADEKVITPIRPQASDAQQAPESIPTPPETSPSSVMASTSSSPVAQVTLENSQVVTIPTKQIPVANPTGSGIDPPSLTSQTVEPKFIDDKSAGKGTSFVAEAGATAVVLGGATLAVSGRVEPNTDDLSPKAKVVMITNEPYGLDTGRRFYNGVDITINDPIPASDVRKYCDAGKVNNDCTDTITGFLGEVSTSNNGMEPSAEQQETATAVLSYLDSLSGLSVGGGDASSETVVAFSSYLNGLSTGEIDAPTSPQSVACYLGSLDDSSRRLSTIESKVDALESSVDRLPDQVSDRLLQWQENQEERLAKEFLKIEEYLVNGNGGNQDSALAVNGEGIELKVPFS